METVSLRELRGAHLRNTARGGKLLAITNHKALVAVVVPVAAPWVEHLVDYNWAHVRQSIAEGEQAVASGVRMVTLSALAAEAPKAPEAKAPEAKAPEAKAPEASDLAPVERDSGEIPERMVIPITSSASGLTEMHSVPSKEVVDRFRALTSPAADADQASDSGPVVSVRIGDLTARLIEQVSQAGQIIALTHERELIGLVVPITSGLVEFLIEQSLSRVVYNIVMGEKELSHTGKLNTLADVADGPRLR
jgi:hypothetical protein